MCVSQSWSNCCCCKSSLLHVCLDLELASFALSYSFMSTQANLFGAPCVPLLLLFFLLAPSIWEIKTVCKSKICLLLHSAVCLTSKPRPIHLSSLLHLCLFSHFSCQTLHISLLCQRVAAFWVLPVHLCFEVLVITIIHSMFQCFSSSNTLLDCKCVCVYLWLPMGNWWAIVCACSLGRLSLRVTVGSELLLLLFSGLSAHDCPSLHYSWSFFFLFVVKECLRMNLSSSLPCVRCQQSN